MSTNKEQYEVLMSELATTIKSLTNSTGKLTLEQIVTKAKQITPVPTLSGNATVNQVLKDATFYNTDPNTKLTGTIETFTPSTVTSNGTLQTSGKYVNDNIVVEVPSPTLNGDAEASNVLSGKTFYSNSTTKQTGTMFNNGQEHGIINNTTTPRYPISQGYHDGTGYVEINASQIADCVEDNILQGKTILGVQGTLVKGITPTGALDITNNGTKDVTNYASVNVNVPLPTLNAPTISLSNSTVTITNPVTNGSFVSGYDVYKNGTLLTSITLATVDLSTLITDSGTYTITVKAKGTNFNESVASNSVEYTVSSVSFVQVYPEKDGEYTTLSNMNTSKIYSVKDYGYFQYSNGSWESSYYGFSINSQSATSVTFRDTSGGDSIFGSWADIIVVEGDTIATQVDYTGMTGTEVLAKWACFAEGTLITMADSTQKKVEDIEYGDEVLCYDFEKGEQTTSYIDWMIPKQTATEYWKITLSDDTVLKLVGPKNGPNKDKSHRFYNVTKQSFMYPQDFEKDDLTLKENGDLVKVVSCEKIFETVNFYNISSKDHINVYAENVLTSNRLNNRFEIKNNKFTNKQLMTDEEIKAYKEHLERLKKNDKK